MTIVVRPKMRLRPDPREGSVSGTAGVSVGSRVIEGLGEGETEIGLGVCVAVGVTGGVTRSSNFCPGWMTELLFNPFQAMKSASEISYKSEIHESVSPLWTVW